MCRLSSLPAGTSACVQVEKGHKTDYNVILRFAAKSLEFETRGVDIGVEGRPEIVYETIMDEDMVQAL